jgi:hypothetical protein
MCTAPLCALVLALLGPLAQSQLQTGPTAPLVSLGTRIECYEYRPGLLVSVKRDNRGAITDVAVETAFLAGTTVPVQGFLSDGDVSQLVDELAPPETRGPRAEYYGLIQCINSNCTTHYSYRDVDIVWVQYSAQGSCTKSVLLFHWRSTAPYKNVMPAR